MLMLRLHGTGKANTHTSTFLFQGMSLNNLEFHTKMLSRSGEVDGSWCSRWPQILYWDNWYWIKHTKEKRGHIPSYLDRAAAPPSLPPPPPGNVNTSSQSASGWLLIFADLFCLLCTWEPPVTISELGHCTQRGSLHSGLSQSYLLLLHPDLQSNSGMAPCSSHCVWGKPSHQSCSSKKTLTRV